MIYCTPTWLDELCNQFIIILSDIKQYNRSCDIHLNLCLIDLAMIIITIIMMTTIILVDDKH